MAFETVHKSYPSGERPASPLEGPATNAAKPAPITIGIVEDDFLIRSGLSEILEEEEDFECVGSFSSAELALVSLPELKPKMIIMDVNLPGMSGIECVKRLTATPDPPQIIMLTVRQDPEIIFDSLAAGACGYLLKPPMAAQLIAAIRNGSVGSAPMTASIARRVMQSFKQKGADSAEPVALSQSEIQILELLVKGFAYKEVSSELNISDSTVQHHIKSIYRKLHAHSRTRAA